MFQLIALRRLWAFVVPALFLLPSAASAATIQAESMTRTPSGAGTLVSDAAASGGSSQLLWSNGALTTTSSSSISAISVRARGDQCLGSPQFQLTVDGTIYSAVNVTQTAWTTITIPLSPARAAGSHTITLTYPNDPETSATCDRNLRVDSIDVTPSTSVAPIEAETLARTPSGSGALAADAAASGGSSQLLWSNGSLTLPVKTGMSTVAVRTRGDQCVGAPQFQLTVDGKAYGAVSASWTAWTTTTITLATPLPAGAHTVVLTYPNDAETSTSCDRNLRVDWIGADVSATSTPAATPPPAGAPSGITKLYRDPISLAAKEATALRAAGRTTDAALIDKIAGQPSALWITGHTGDNGRIDTSLAAAASEKSRVVFALYAIPDRDSGGYSAGGLANAAAYRAWVDNLASKVGSKPTTMIIEPDAVAQPVADQAGRNAMLSYAVTKLSALPDTKVYLDAANSSWYTPAGIVPRLKAAGVANADGIAVNTSNFQTTAAETTYARAITTAIGGGKHFVIDTGRNGYGPYVAPAGTNPPATDFWCNPTGRALGSKPTMITGVSDIDGYLWIKPPGETDGPCHGGPSLGFFTADALNYARRAAW